MYGIWTSGNYTVGAAAYMLFKKATFAGTVQIADKQRAAFVVESPFLVTWMPEKTSETGKDSTLSP